jgi:hypothetical protein
MRDHKKDYATTAGLQLPSSRIPSLPLTTAFIVNDSTLLCIASNPPWCTLGFLTLHDTDRCLHHRISASLIPLDTVMSSISLAYMQRTEFR